MKIITSPAKLMKVGHTSDFIKETTPTFIQEAEFIQSYLKQESPKDLAKLMELSSKLADENWHRNQVWNAKPKAEEKAPALFAFTGEVYRGLDAASLDKTAVDYLQKNYIILSGLYGLLKPSDKVMLYRLEMGRPFKFDTHKNLYEFWREKLTEQLNSQLKKDEIILNLASNEYAKAIDFKNIKGKVIDFKFYEIKSGTPKQVVVYTKHARGLVVRFCAEKQAQTLEDVKTFNYEGYLINDELSTDSHLVFTR